MQSVLFCGILNELVKGVLFMEVGLKYSETIAVTTENVASTLHSGALQVFATPAMIALMEMTCMDAVQPHLDEGLTTVGTLVNVQHLAPTPLGMNVVCDCVLKEIDGRRLVFSVEARDEKDIIGTGIHERVIVKADKFSAKANAKLD